MQAPKVEHGGLHHLPRRPLSGHITIGYRPESCSRQKGRVGRREPPGTRVGGAVGAPQLGCWPSSCRMSRAGRPPRGPGVRALGSTGPPGVSGLVKAGRQQARTTTCNMRRKAKGRAKGCQESGRERKNICGADALARCEWSRINYLPPEDSTRMSRWKILITVSFANVV